MSRRHICLHFLLHGANLPLLRHAVGREYYHFGMDHAPALPSASLFLWYLLKTCRHASQTLEDKYRYIRAGRSKPPSRCYADCLGFPAAVIMSGSSNRLSCMWVSFEAGCFFGSRPFSDIYNYYVMKFSLFLYSSPLLQIISLLLFSFTDSFPMGLMGSFLHWPECQSSWYFNQCGTETSIHSGCLVDCASADRYSRKAKMDTKPLCVRLHYFPLLRFQFLRRHQVNEHNNICRLPRRTSPFFHKRA